ncbi:MAG TPA: hypothetical protein VMM92_11630 [Thermoanaerobaculia bacterium]|nr:hypothetical protein [Thermoanaerobaculia bacterium]
MTPENQHVIHVLKESIRAARLRNRDVERILGLSSSYLSRLFAGTIELRFEHIIDIGRAVGLEPFEIIHAIYPQPRNPPSPAMERLREVLRHLQPPPPPPPVWTPESRAAFERNLERALWRTLGRLALKPSSSEGRTAALEPASTEVPAMPSLDGEPASAVTAEDGL